MGSWKFVSPESTTNLLSDPSFEFGTLATYWTTAVGGGTGTAALSTAQSFYGRSSVLLTPGTAGVIIYQAITTAAADHTLAFMVRRSDGGTVSNSDVQAYIDGAAANFDSITLVGNSWYRCVKTATETAAAHNTGIKSLIGGTAVYVDGAQFEAKGYYTTFCDGTQPGCSWTGAAHASTSTRSAQERSGGKVIDIDDTYSVKTTLMTGFGMPAIAHNVTGQAIIPGAVFQSYKVQPREFIMTFAVSGSSLANYHSKRDNLIEALKPDKVTPTQPVRLIYTGNTNQVQIDAYYNGGLEGEIKAGRFERLAARFVAYDPWFKDVGDSATTLTEQLSVANADYGVRKVDGAWTNISTDFDNNIYAVAYNPVDGRVYIGGAFTNVGDASGDKIVVYNPATGTISSLGTGAADNTVYGIAIAPNGDVYVGGSFTGMGGVANTARIACWDISASAWVEVGGGIASGIVYDVAFDQNGNLYIVGTFANHGDANGDGLTMWNGSAYSSLSTGVNAEVYSLAVGLDNTIYFVGNFTDAGDANGDYIVAWDGTAFSSLGTGANSWLQGIAVGPDGTLYVGGNATSFGGVSASYIAAWNGTSWAALGSGCNAAVYQIAIGDDGLAYVGGNFTSAGGISLADRIAVWNGSSWAHLDVDLPGTPIIYSISKWADSFYLGYSTSGTATAAKNQTITNNGSTTAYPKFVFRRSGGTTARIEWIKNETTGDVLWLNYSLLDGETLTIDLTPGNKSITSDYAGNVLGRALLPNSDFATFSLQPGANTISVYVYEAGTPTVTAYCLFQAPYWSVDGAA